MEGRRRQKQRSEGGKFLEEKGKSAGEAITKVQSPAVLGPARLHQQSLAAVPLTPDHHRLLDDVKMFQTGLAPGGVAEGFPLERILSARVFITICGPEKFVCKRL